MLCAFKVGAFYLKGLKGKKNVNLGWEPVFLDAFHVMCFYSPKSRNTPQGSESKLLNNVPVLKANPGKYLFVCLFCFPELP